MATSDKQRAELRQWAEGELAPENDWMLTGQGRYACESILALLDDAERVERFCRPGFSGTGVVIPLSSTRFCWPHDWQPNLAEAVEAAESEAPDA